MAAAYAVACFGKYFDDRGVVLQTENEGVAHFAQKLYRRCGVQGTVISKERPTGPVYEFSVKDPDEVAKMLALFGHTGKEPTLRIRPENFKCQNCMQAFIATAFLCCGTMTDPEKAIIWSSSPRGITFPNSWRPCWRSITSTRTAHCARARTRSTSRRRIISRTC